jgi:probable phosphoglycerate mutase
VELILIRHGETQRNVLGGNVLCGRADSPLTEEGIRQAAELSKNPALSDVQKVISSNLGRAYTTAKIAFPGKENEIEQSEDFAERSLGELEGKREEDVIREYGYTKDALEVIRHNLGTCRAPGGGENYNDVKARVSRGISKVEFEAKLNGWEKVAIVLHGVAMKVAIADLIGEDLSLAFKMSIPHCEPIVLENRKGSKLYTLKTPTWGRLIKK